MNNATNPFQVVVTSDDAICTRGYAERNGLAFTLYEDDASAYEDNAEEETGGRSPAVTDLMLRNLSADLDAAVEKARTPHPGSGSRGIKGEQVNRPVVKIPAVQWPEPEEVDVVWEEEPDTEPMPEDRPTIPVMQSAGLGDVVRALSGSVGQW